MSTIFGDGPSRTVRPGRLVTTCAIYIWFRIAHVRHCLIIYRFLNYHVKDLDYIW
jgi:hypothetical protein